MNTLCSYEYIIYPWIGKDTLYTAIPGCLGGGANWGKVGASGYRCGESGANGVKVVVNGGSGEQMDGLDVGQVGEVGASGAVGSKCSG